MVLEHPTINWDSAVYRSYDVSAHCWCRSVAVCIDLATGGEERGMYACTGWEASYRLSQQFFERAVQGKFDEVRVGKDRILWKQARKMTWIRLSCFVPLLPLNKKKARFGSWKCCSGYVSSSYAAVLACIQRPETLSKSHSKVSDCINTLNWPISPRTIVSLASGWDFPSD